MATELETRTRTTTSTGRRVFSGLNTDQRTEYRRPNFSSINFDQAERQVEVQTSYDTMVEEISIDTPKKVDMLTIEKTIEQRPISSQKVKLNARGKIFVTVLSVCICALMAFMIGNFVTINNLNSVVSEKQQMVMQQQEHVGQLQDDYDSKGNNVENSAKEQGYQKIESDQIEQINGVDAINKPQAQIDGNWFDDLCNWLSGLFN